MKFLILLALVAVAAAQVQIQIPVQRPQQMPQWQPPQLPQRPQQPPQWQPQPPQAPRADWREGAFDSRCPNPDDVTGQAFLLPGNTANTFFICWGQIAWPFTCPEGTTYWTARTTCAFPEQIAAGSNWQRIRPFANDEEVEAEEN